MSEQATRLFPDRVLWVDTASGSRYRLDPAARRWSRLSHDRRSEAVRTEDGELIALLSGPAIGEAMILIGPALEIDSGTRVIETSPVTAISEREPRDPPRPAAGFWD